MKIGVVGTIWLNTPPKGYGGTEDVVYNIVNGMTARGHDVTLFGPGTVEVDCKLVATVEKPLREMGVDWENSLYALYHITEAFDRADEFDILHVHLNKSSDFVSLPLSLNIKTPVVFTLHFQVTGPEQARDQYMVLHKYRELPFISISNAQRRPNALNYISTVYNGLDLRRFPYSGDHGKYLVWLGKVNPVKGTKEAIAAARRAGVKLYVVGAVDRAEPRMLAYYENEIKPIVDGEQVVFLGEVTHDKKTSVLGGATAFLNPILWEEPFGLVMAEAQATGTPVISFRRGAAPEVINDGKTGFLVDTLDEMVEKIKDADGLSRRDCRDWIEGKFTVETMVSGYEIAYNKAIENWGEYVEKQRKLLG